MCTFTASTLQSGLYFCWKLEGSYGDNGIKHNKEQNLMIIIHNKNDFDKICIPNTWYYKYQFCLSS